MARKKKTTIVEETVSEEKTPMEGTFEEKKRKIVERIEKMDDDSMYTIEIDGMPLGGITQALPGKIWKSILPEIEKTEE